MTDTEPSGIPREFEEDDWLIVHLHGVEKGREAERAKIVAWLRKDDFLLTADAIENGEHLK